MGSLVDLTFPLVYVGSNLKITNDIVRGNNFNCQDLIESKDPLVVINDDLLKRNDELYYSLNTLKFLKNINSSMNILNSTLRKLNFFLLASFASPFS